LTGQIVQFFFVLSKFSRLSQTGAEHFQILVSRR
jgi:hypothetical protein